MRRVRWLRGGSERRVGGVQICGAVRIAVVVRVAPAVVVIVGETAISPTCVLEGAKVAETRRISPNAGRACNREPWIRPNIEDLRVPAVLWVAGIGRELDSHDTVGEREVRNEYPAMRREDVGGFSLNRRPLLRRGLQHSVNGDGERKGSRAILRSLHRFTRKGAASRIAENNQCYQRNEQTALHGVPFTYSGFSLAAARNRDGKWDSDRQTHGIPERFFNRSGAKILDCTDRARNGTGTRQEGRRGRNERGEQAQLRRSTLAAARAGTATVHHGRKLLWRVNTTAGGHVGLVMTNASDAAIRTTPEAVATQLAQEGAILTLKGETFLVGHLVWLRSDRIFCFAANGNEPKRDGHLLMFDVVRIENPAEITFWRKHRVVARLTSIADQELADADDLRAAWRVWQQRRPLCERLIGASLAHHVNGGPRR